MIKVLLLLWMINPETGNFEVKKTLEAKDLTECDNALMLISKDVEFNDYAASCLEIVEV